LGWIVGIRFALVLVVPMSLLFALVIEVRSATVGEWIGKLAMLATAALYYWRLSLQIQLVHEAARTAA